MKALGFQTLARGLLREEVRPGLFRAGYFAGLAVWPARPPVPGARKAPSEMAARRNFTD